MLTTTTKDPNLMFVANNHIPNSKMDLLIMSLRLGKLRFACIPGDLLLVMTDERTSRRLDSGSHNSLGPKSLLQILKCSGSRRLKREYISSIGLSEWGLHKTGAAE